MFRQSIKTNILIIFISLVAIISLSLLSSQYYFSHKLAKETTQKNFKIMSKYVLKELQDDARRLNDILQTNSYNKEFSYPITETFNHPALTTMMQIMKLNDNIYSTYFNDTKNSLFLVINMKKSIKFFEKLKVPSDTKWLVILYISNKQHYFFLNKKRELISKYSIDRKFKLLSRPWYKKAILAKGPITTRPYKFANSQESGISFAIKLHNEKRVFAIDYTLGDFNKLLKELKFEEDSEIFIFNKNGHYLASSEMKNTHKVDNSLQNLVITNKINTSQKNGYYSSYLPLNSKNIFLGIQINSKALLQPYIKSLEYSFIIALLVLILSIPLILLATQLIIKPIQALIKENDKIKNRHFDVVKKIDTNIIEFIEFSNSLVSMSQNIKEYQKSQEELLDSIVKLIAEAVDAKSPYTGGHCRRVPVIAQMLINNATKSQEGIFKEFQLSNKDALREFEIGAWLHDCGKVTTPEYVVDKSTKLETINNRIHEIRTRFEVLWRDAQITHLEATLNGEDATIALKTLHSTQNQLLEDFEFIANANIGGEYMSPDKQARIRSIGLQEWTRHFSDMLGLGEAELLRYDKENTQSLPAIEKLLSDKKQHIVKRENFDYKSYERHGFKEEVPEYLYNYGELYNLCINKGTLSPEERYKINEHVILTIKMLEKIPFPSQMTKIPEYAGTHHETLIGTGYPRKLTKEELSIPARIMALADIFEALTASDRPYKKAKTLSESINILSLMVKDEHLDADVFQLFLKSGLHLTYAKKYLKPEQIDEVNVEQYL